MKAVEAGSTGDNGDASWKQNLCLTRRRVVFELCATGKLYLASCTNLWVLDGAPANFSPYFARLAHRTEYNEACDHRGNIFWVAGHTYAFTSRNIRVPRGTLLSTLQ